MPWPEQPLRPGGPPTDPAPFGPVFIEPDTLAARLDDPAVIVFDASYFPAGIDRDPDREHLACRIPGARRLDIRTLSDPSSPYPNMLPHRAQLEALLRESDARRGSDIVLYDSIGLYGAARALWMLQCFGVASARILTGGMPRWLAEGRPTASGPPGDEGAASGREPEARWMLHDPEDAIDRRVVSQALADGSAQLLDARSALTPAGEPVHPVPGFARAPHDAFAHQGRLASPEAIRQTAAAHGIRLDLPAIVTCGTGVAASVVWLALASVGARVQLYDGGFAEWMSRDAPPRTGDPDAPSVRTRGRAPDAGGTSGHPG